MAEAEALLPGFLVRFNRQFTVPAAEPGTAYRPLPASVVVENVCCLAYERTVASDNTISFGGEQWQLQPTAERASYARTRVTVYEHLGGSVTVAYQGVPLATRAAPPTASDLRARKGAGGQSRSTSAFPEGPALEAQYPAPTTPGERRFGQNH